MSVRVEKPALQKADTEWNTEKRILSGISCPRLPKTISAPAISVRNVIRIIFTRILNRLFRDSEEKISFKTMESRMEEPDVKIKLKNPVNVMIPSPPTWIRHRTMIFPVVVKVVAVFTTVRPVTQTALTEVKSESRNDKGPVRALGIIKSPDPIRIIRRKLSENKREGGNLTELISRVIT